MKTIACVQVTPDTAGWVAQTVRHLAANSLTCAGIVVAVDAADLPDPKAVVAAARGIPLEFAPPEQALGIVKDRVRAAAASGALLLGAGMHLPHGFDARLVRLAADDATVGTVSPFCDLSAAHWLLESPRTGAHEERDVARLDRLAFLLGSKTGFEVPAYLPECCFVAAAALDTFAAPSGGCVHVMSDSVYVDKLPGAPLAARLTPGGAAAPALARSRQAIAAAYRTGADFHGMPGVDARPIQLHVIHDLGGGSSKWLRDFGLADTQRVNLVLRSFSQGDGRGAGIALYTDVRDTLPLKAWNFSRPITGTVVAHVEHRRAFEEIVADFAVDVVLVSSFIGHSLEVLDTGLPTVVVNHDYFPYCPAINIHFGGVCRRCDGERIVECHRNNPEFNPFVTFLPPERIAVRQRFMELVARPGVTMAVPSDSVRENLTILNSRFADVAFTTIPHGYTGDMGAASSADPLHYERLRILVLGQLSVAKGVELLREALAELTAFADVYLMGTREVGEEFRFVPRVHVLTNYEPGELPIHVANVKPHVGLLMSIVPETFSYALTELMMLGVPVAGTRVGSLAERIRHLENGYLFDPDAVSVVATMKAIDTDRATLAKVRANVLGWRPPTAEHMVEEYRRITPVAAASLARYPAGSRREAANEAGPSQALTVASQAATVANMWKEVKSLHMQLAIVNEARLRSEVTRGQEAEQYRRDLDDRAALKKRLADQETLAAENERQAQQHIQHLAVQVNMKTAKLDEMLASTSWKASAPIRYTGRRLRNARILARCLASALRQRGALRENGRRLHAAWRDGGFMEFKRTLLEMEAREMRPDAWREYRETFRREVRPKIVERIATMAAKPLVSVIVPTYNTAEPMLRQMLQSVTSQLYPRWELCIADDGSQAPHVRRMLKEHAAKDKRIKLHFGENMGVSHASNRALDLATGDFVVLLDHDDVLEEQALFRVAESVVEDQPDMVYSDEVLVAPDADVVERYAYRPAFSREYLRSHPYIVHLVGFRTQLLRDLGGFDESLRISQDYDLILRVAEKARTIVHIPEILYQWRLHGGSAGTQRMQEVMETSKAVLRRHLQRSGERATVDDGTSFNLFDVRYALEPGRKVAIVIPTKNCGDLLRQCIESIRATVKDVDYDIVVIDHESNEPATLAYLASLGPTVPVLRYQGVFNFSAINNWAVSRLTGSYSHYLFCNNDIEAIHEGWLERMMELGQQPSIGIVGAKLFYPDRESIQHAGVCVGAYGAAEHYGKRLRFPGDPVERGFGELLLVNHEVAAVTAACLLIRRDAFEEIGGFDEAILVGFGDVDLCLRAGERGYRIVFCPHAKLVHHESYTRGTSTIDPHPEDSALYRFKWKELLHAGDPFHSPGLSLTSTQWALKNPLHCDFDIRRRIVRGESQDGKRGRVHFS